MVLLMAVVDVDVLFVAFRTLEVDDFIVVGVLFGLLRFWMVGAMGRVFDGFVLRL